MSLALGSLDGARTRPGVWSRGRGREGGSPAAAEVWALAPVSRRHLRLVQASHIPYYK